jgi:hypothetical protein
MCGDEECEAHLRITLMADRATFELLSSEDPRRLHRGAMIDDVGIQQILATAEQLVKETEPDYLPEGFERRDVEVVLPVEEARAMWERARAQWPNPRPVRDEEERSVLTLWADETETSIPVLGHVLIKSASPDAEHATIWRLQWIPEHGGSEAVLRDAIVRFRGRYD